MKTILSIDGGGVRGLMEAMILHQIEIKLREKVGKKVNLVEYVDIVSGASTGGIIAALLTYPLGNEYRYDTSDVVRFYNKHCFEIFNKSKRIFGGITYKYSEKTLEKYLNQYLGDLKIKDLKNHVIIPILDLNTSEGVFFSNIKDDKEKIKYKISDICRGTSAAPTYFKPKKIGKYLSSDGGMVANNTSICCIAKERKYNNTSLKDISVINIGSGSVMPKETKNWWLMKWATKLPLVMLYDNINLVKHQLQQLELGKLFIIDVPKIYQDYSEDMADASIKNMQKLRGAAFKTFGHKTKEINEIVNFLIENKCK